MSSITLQVSCTVQWNDSLCLIHGSSLAAFSLLHGSHGLQPQLRSGRGSPPSLPQLTATPLSSGLVIGFSCQGLTAQLRSQMSSIFLDQLPAVDGRWRCNPGRAPKKLLQAPAWVPVSSLNIPEKYRTQRMKKMRVVSVQAHSIIYFPKSQNVIMSLSLFLFPLYVQCSYFCLVNNHQQYNHCHCNKSIFHYIVLAHNPYFLFTKLSKVTSVTQSFSSSMLHNTSLFVYSIPPVSIIHMFLFTLQYNITRL